MKYFAALLSIALGAFAQFLFKTGVEQLKLAPQKIWQTGIKNSSLWLGITCYAVSLLVWFYVLSRMELSKAYPLVSGGYVITAILGFYFLNENLSLCKMIGIFCILTGIFFISKS